MTYLHVVVENAFDPLFRKLVSGAKIFISTVIIGKEPVCENWEREFSRGKKG